MVRHFEPAPWPLVLKLSSALGTVITVGAAVFIAMSVPAEDLGTGLFALTMVVTLAVPVVAWLMRVQGYEIEGQELRVLRPIGPVRRSLGAVSNVETGRQVLEGSVRAFGNGGFFAFTGWYWSRAKGRMRLWVTDPYRPVLLVIGGEKVVLSPSDTDGLAKAVRSAAKG